jgi:hypothetical protein
VIEAAHFEIMGSLQIPEFRSEMEEQHGPRIYHRF